MGCAQEIRPANYLELSSKKAPRLCYANGRAHDEGLLVVASSLAETLPQPNAKSSDRSGGRLAAEIQEDLEGRRPQQVVEMDAQRMTPNVTRLFYARRRPGGYGCACRRRLCLTLKKSRRRVQAPNCPHRFQRDRAVRDDRVDVPRTTPGAASNSLQRQDPSSSARPAGQFTDHSASARQVAGKRIVIAPGLPSRGQADFFRQRNSRHA